MNLFHDSIRHAELGSASHAIPEQVRNDGGLRFRNKSGMTVACDSGTSPE